MFLPESVNNGCLHKFLFSQANTCKKENCRFLFQGVLLYFCQYLGEHEWLKAIMLLHFLSSLYAKQINYNQCLVFNQRGSHIEMI